MRGENFRSQTINLAEQPADQLPGKHAADDGTRLHSVSTPSQNPHQPMETRQRTPSQGSTPCARELGPALGTSAILVSRAGNAQLKSWPVLGRGR